MRIAGYGRIRMWSRMRVSRASNHFFSLGHRRGHVRAAVCADGGLIVGALLLSLLVGAGTVSDAPYKKRHVVQTRAPYARNIVALRLMHEEIHMADAEALYNLLKERNR